MNDEERIRIEAHAARHAREHFNHRNPFGHRGPRRLVFAEGFACTYGELLEEAKSQPRTGPEPDPATDPPAPESPQDELPEPGPGVRTEEVEQQGRGYETKPMDREG